MSFFSTKKPHGINNLNTTGQNMSGAATNCKTIGENGFVSLRCIRSIHLQQNNTKVTYFLIAFSASSGRKHETQQECNSV